MVKRCSHPAYGHPWDSCTLCLCLQDWCKVKPAKNKQSKERGEQKINLSYNNKPCQPFWVTNQHGAWHMFPERWRKDLTAVWKCPQRTASSLAPPLVGVLGRHGPSQREKTLCSLPALCQSAECWFRHNEQRHRCWSQALPVYDRRMNRTPSSQAGADAGRYSDLPMICTHWHEQKHTRCIVCFWKKSNIPQKNTYVNQNNKGGEPYDT